MDVDGAGRLHLVDAVPVLRPDEQVLQKMLDGWRNQQLSRNLQFATIEQRLRVVQRFMNHVNEDPWNWTPAMVEEFSADLRMVKKVSNSTLRGHHSALRAFTQYISDPQYGFVDACEKFFGTPLPSVLRLEHRSPRPGVRRTAHQAAVHPRGDRRALRSR